MPHRMDVQLKAHSAGAKQCRGDLQSLSVPYKAPHLAHLIRTDQENGASDECMSMNTVYKLLLSNG